ncbi:F0F1 ATP synthase subunit gamma [Hahella ganghwensis]|uniref:F0F1 ATP synthase subunit gamma n=1 Tax=Hahella ganghwensis TaxID=286420 RepID=UPI00035EF523|nr:F0F1 ATP synthase subunit gamma [Hahella ganghwensis]
MNNRELSKQKDLYATLSKILSALKALAYAESLKLQRQLSSQLAVNNRMKSAVRQLLNKPDVHAGRALIIVIGTERGFCGDINHKLIHFLAQGTRQFQTSILDLPATFEFSVPFDASMPFQSQLPFDCILVGERLSQVAGEKLQPLARVPGVSVVEDVESVVDNLVSMILYFSPRENLFNLWTLTFSEEEAKAVLIPVFPRPESASFQGAEPLRYRSVADLLEDMIPMYLFTALQTCIKQSLLVENRKRLSHLENTTRHLNDRLDILSLKSNRARQEAIIDEIEALLASETNSSR